MRKFCFKTFVFVLFFGVTCNFAKAEIITIPVLEDARTMNFNYGGKALPQHETFTAAILYRNGNKSFIFTKFDLSEVYCESVSSAKFNAPIYWHVGNYELAAFYVDDDS